MKTKKVFSKVEFFLSFLLENIFFPVFALVFRLIFLGVGISLLVGSFMLAITPPTCPAILDKIMFPVIFTVGLVGGIFLTIKALSSKFENLTELNFD